MLRTFIAVRIPVTPPLRRILHRLGELGRSVRIVDFAAMHITLKFLGDVHAEQIPDIVETMKKASEGCRPFEIDLTGTGVFPNLRRPTVIWAGVRHGEPLIGLAKNLEDALAAFGFPPEQRSYTPHLTLARIKSKPPPEFFDIVRQFAETEFGSSGIDDLILFQSETRSTGPVYTPLATIQVDGE